MNSRLNVCAMAEVGSGLLTAIDHLILTSAAISPATQTLGAPRVVVHRTGYTVYLAFPTIDREAMAAWIAQGVSAGLMATLIEAAGSGCAVINFDEHAPTPDDVPLIDAHLTALVELGMFNKNPILPAVKVSHNVVPGGHYVVIDDGRTDQSILTRSGTPEELEAYVAVEQATLARKARGLLRILAGAMQMRAEKARQAA